MRTRRDCKPGNVNEKFVLWFWNA